MPKRWKDLLLRVTQHLKKYRNKTRYGYGYLAIAILVQCLERLFNQNTRLEELPISLTCIDFTSRPEYRVLYGPRRAVYSSSYSIKDCKLDKRTLRSFTSFKHKDFTAEYGCAVFTSPILKSSHGVFSTSSGEMLKAVWQESTHDDNFLSAQILCAQDIANPRKLKGFHASLLGPWARNYYHWLLQYLPRLHLIDKYCGLSSVDGFLIPSPVLPFHLESLNFLGIDRRRLIEVNGSVCPDKCIISSIPCENRLVPFWVIDFLRAYVSKGEQVSSGRIFVMRGGVGRRQIVNQSEVIDVVRQHGFHCVDPGRLSFANQVSLFSRSSAVCGVHGAALSNIAFCSKGVSVIELIPANYLYPCFQRLSAAASLSYYPLFGSEPRIPLSNLMLPDADILVDTAQLSLLFEQLSS